MDITAPKIRPLHGSPKHNNDLNFIYVIYGDHLSKYYFTDGTFRKITVFLYAQKRNANYVEHGLTNFDYIL
jgi:hypothetical protein